MNKTWVPLSFCLAMITALGILAFIILCIKKNEVKKVCQEINNNEKPIKWAIVLMSIIFIVNVCLTIYTLNKVENPAYSQIIKNTNVIFILILSILIFKTKININCIIGVLLCLLGIGIIIFNN